MGELNNEGAIVKGFADALEQHKKSVNEDLANLTKGADFEEFKKKHAETTDSMMSTMKDMQSEVVKMRNNMATKASESKSELYKSIMDFKGDGKISQKLYAGEKLITKAVGTITIGGNFTGQVTRFDQRPGIAGPMHTSLDVRNLLRITTATSDKYNFRKGLPKEGGIAPVAEASAKPQIDYNFTNTSTPVVKIAGHADLSMESLDDTDNLESFINNELMMDLKDERNSQLIYGDGIGDNMTGLAANALDATSLTSYPTQASAQNWDALLAAMSALASRNYMANVILLSPTDYFPMVGQKGTDGHYLRDMLVWNGGTPFLYGVPIIVSTAVTAGSFIMWDQRAAEYAARMSTTIKRSTEHANNFIENLETFVIEERAALAIIYADAVFEDTFAAVITEITT